MFVMSPTKEWLGASSKMLASWNEPGNVDFIWPTIVVLLAFLTALLEHTSYAGSCDRERMGETRVRHCVGK